MQIEQSLNVVEVVALEQPVAEWMTQDPDHVNQSDPIRNAIRVMQRGGFRHVPIVDKEGGVIPLNIG